MVPNTTAWTGEALGWCPVGGPPAACSHPALSPCAHGHLTCPQASRILPTCSPHPIHTSVHLAAPPCSALGSPSCFCFHSPQTRGPGLPLAPEVCMLLQTLLDLDSAHTLGGSSGLKIMLGKGKTGYQSGEVLVAAVIWPAGGKGELIEGPLFGWVFILPQRALSVTTSHFHLLAQP